MADSDDTYKTNVKDSLNKARVEHPEEYAAFEKLIYLEADGSFDINNPKFQKAYEKWRKHYVTEYEIESNDVDSNVPTERLKTLVQQHEEAKKLAAIREEDSKKLAQDITLRLNKSRVSATKNLNDQTEQFIETAVDKAAHNAINYKEIDTETIIKTVSSEVVRAVRVANHIDSQDVSELEITTINIVRTAAIGNDFVPNIITTNHLEIQLNDARTAGPHDVRVYTEILKESVKQDLNNYHYKTPIERDKDLWDKTNKAYAIIAKGDIENNAPFFEAVTHSSTATPFQKTTAKIMDAGLFFFPEKIRNTIQAEIIKKTILNLPNESQKLIDRFGTDFAGLLPTLKADLSTRPTNAGQTLGKIGSIAADFGYTVFRTPLEGEIAQILTIESQLSKLKNLDGSSLLSKSRNLFIQPQSSINTTGWVINNINLKYFYTPIVASRLLQQHPIYIQVNPAKQFILSFIKNESVNITSSALISATKAGLSQKIKEGGFKFITNFISSLIGGAGVTAATGGIGGLGILASKALTALGVNVFGKIQKGLVNLATGGFLINIMNGKTDSSAILILILVASPIFFMVFLAGPTQQRLTMTSLATAGTGSDQTPGSPFVAGPANPTRSDSWPTSGCIVEGPYVGTHANAKLNAVDFADPIGTPVYSVTDGTVSTDYFMRYSVGDIMCTTAPYRGSASSPKPNCASITESYGNHIIIEGIDSNKQPFKVFYGHLAAAYQGIVPGVSVKAHELIGYMDDNGYSLGPHLHFEYQGGGSLTDPARTILPMAVPSCIDFASCNAGMGGKACIN
jgi:murein DD-endopeptidase MepM/ murein hydrolase activator NlpD